jgi:hypothetical protein
VDGGFAFFETTYILRGFFMSADDAVTWLIYYISLFTLLGLAIVVEIKKDKEEQKNIKDRKKEKNYLNNEEN